jgi:hypothetical protein
VTGRPDARTPALASSSSSLRMPFLRLPKPSSQLLDPDAIAAARAVRVTSFTSSGSPRSGTRVERAPAPGAEVAPGAAGAGAAGAAGSCVSVTPPEPPVPEGAPPGGGSGRDSTAPAGGAAAPCACACEAMPRTSMPTPRRNSTPRFIKPPSARIAEDQRRSRA